MDIWLIVGKTGIVVEIVEAVITLLTYGSLFLAHICVWRGVFLYVIWFFYLVRTFGGNTA
jgi:hypothetical protein